MNLFKNRALLFNILNGLIPLFGILFLGWSALDVFVLFILELLLLGFFTLLKIIFSGSKNGNKGSSIFMFCLLYPIAFMFIFILLGNFFDGSNRQMNFSLSNYAVYFLLGVYLFNFIYNYIIKQGYKTAAAKNIVSNTFLKMGAIFLVLFVILLPITKLVPEDSQSILMGSSIAFCRLAVDNFIDKKLERNV